VFLKGASRRWHHDSFLWLSVEPQDATKGKEKS
jgi:hypothetical protein